MKNRMRILIDYAENVLRHSSINAHLIIVKAKELEAEELAEQTKGDKKLATETNKNDHHSKNSRPAN